jgi:mRNA interferase RelE/StbE
MYPIRILDGASRNLARLDKPVGRHIIERINWLAANLDLISLEPLTGDLAGLYKLRVGDYRVIYEILRRRGALRLIAVPLAHPPSAALIGRINGHHFSAQRARHRLFDCCACSPNRHVMHTSHRKWPCICVAYKLHW